MRIRFAGYWDFDTQKVFNTTENQLKNTIVTSGHNRKTHRTIAKQTVLILKNRITFLKPMCPTVPYVVIYLR